MDVFAEQILIDIYILLVMYNTFHADKLGYLLENLSALLVFKFVPIP